MVRTLSGLVLVAVFVGAVLGSQWSFGALLLPAVSWAVRRSFANWPARQGLFRRSDGWDWRSACCCWRTEFHRSPAIQPVGDGRARGAVLYLLLALGLLLPTLFVCELFRRSATPLANLGAALLGVLYVAVPLSLLYVPSAHRPTASADRSKQCSVISSSSPTTSSPMWWG